MTVARRVFLAVALVGSSVFAGEARPPRPNADDLKKIEAALPEKAPAAAKKARRLLVFTKATGFVHSSIPVGAKTFELMGKKTGAYETVISDDVESFAPERLKDVDAILMLSTTGELFVPKGKNAGELVRDTGKPLSPELQRAKALRESLLAFVRGGKGIMGIHAATDSSYQWKEWNEVMGGYFNGHPWGKIVMTIDDPANPVNAAFEGKPFSISDEIYTFKGAVGRDRLRILTSIDLEASKIDQGFNRPQDHDYWVSWLNKYGEGRVFYCSLGHAEATYWNPVVLKHYLAGLQFVMGDLEADASPSGPLSPERLAKNAAVAARGWADVSRGEKWYQEKKDVKEQVHTGTLVAVPDAGGVSTLQRTHQYKLDDRLIFTGAKKSEKLDKLVGQKVDVRGKVVEQELEGKHLVELWPGSVRPAQAKQ